MTPRDLTCLATAGTGYVLGALAVLLAGGAIGAAAVLLVVAALAAVLAESLVVTRPALEGALERAQVGATVRAGLRDVLLLGYVAASAAGSPADDTVLLVGGIGLVWLLRGLARVLERDAEVRLGDVVTWRNLDVPGLRRQAQRPSGLLRLHPVVFAVALLLLSLAAVVSAAGGSPTVPVAAVVAAAVGLAVLVAAQAGWREVRTRRAPGPEETARRVGRALEDLGTDLLFYYSRPEPVGYIANVWMPVLHALPHRRFAVIAREQHNADLVETDTLPVVCVTRAVDLERVVPSGTRLALYPSNVATNNHLIRMPGIVDVFVGHGDSDKGGSATTLTRIFDEAWVSGPAARERYRVEQVGVRDDQIREIGRPQLAEIERATSVAATDEPEPGAPGHEEGAPAARPLTVLYAPTREGFFAAWQYSSVLAQGDGILRTLLATPGVRVLFKPHPGTGTDDPRFGTEVARLLDLVRAAGAPHEVVGSTEGLYAAFNRADVLVSDISSVITDFLASGKPYVVTDPSLGDVEAFRSTFPSARGAWVLTGDGSGVGEAIADASGPDRYAAQRAATAAYLLGDQSEDPVARFDAAIDDAVEVARRRIAEQRRSVRDAAGSPPG